jgi:hypothetical protein
VSSLNLFQICSYENDVGILKSQVWEIGDKLLLTEREKKKLEEELSKQEMLLQSIGRQVKNNIKIFIVVCKIFNILCIEISTGIDN